MREKLRSQLESLAEADYKKFNEKLIPGAVNVLGVRLPKMRELAKALAKEDPERLLAELEEALQSDRNAVYYEEIMIYGLVIGYAKFTDDKRREWLDQFRNHIDNWAICDSCCMTYKWMKKNPEKWWEYLEGCIAEQTEFSIRFAVVCMLAHYINEAYVGQVLDWCDRISHEGYYVKMAVAWAVSVCFVKYPEFTMKFLQTNHMDDFTHNKSIQKICESYRPSKEEKMQVRLLKRK